jgi:NFU1 iron-sulfur cluster scaffold homolog, mitochondrial
MRTNQEILAQVDEVMEKYIAPNVAQHGGQINILNFDETSGILHTQLSGSCSGCASSTATLKMGVETTLMHFIPEITAVTSEDDPDFNNPFYYPDSGFDDY